MQVFIYSREQYEQALSTHELKWSIVKSEMWWKCWLLIPFQKSVMGACLIVQKKQFCSSLGSISSCQTEPTTCPCGHDLGVREGRHSMVYLHLISASHSVQHGGEGPKGFSRLKYEWRITMEMSVGLESWETLENKVKGNYKSFIVKFESWNVFSFSHRFIAVRNSPNFLEDSCSLGKFLIKQIE